MCSIIQPHREEKGKLMDKNADKNESISTTYTKIITHRFTD